MRILKKIFFFIVILLLLTLIASFFYVQHLKPNYKGEIKLNNLSDKIEVYYDSIGVPHIYAKNQKDAYTTLGYVHAQDRLWQMELVRRISAGRLSEIFGKKFIKTDKFFLGLGIEDAATKSLKELDTTTISYKLTTAYLDGVNQFIKDGATPIEYTIIGIKKEAFRLKDIYNVFGYMSFSFAQAHKTDPYLSKMREKLDPKYLAELDINIDTTKVVIPNYNAEFGVESDFVASVDNIMNNLPISPFIGSNAWVVGAEKTESGKVIFANDPHIAFSQPSVWYQSHIVCPDFEIYGFNLALTPFPLLGHNRNFAYGLTMFENDDIDFYREKQNPNNADEYVVKNSFAAYTIKEKTIKVKDAPNESFFVKVSKHGPIMNDFVDGIDEEDPIAMDWIYTKFKNEMMVATYEISHSNNLSDFESGVEKIIAPGLNVMYGDSQDNIAWFAAGKLYKHTNNVNTKFILDGTNNEDDVLEYLDFSKNPQAINPPWDFVYSANNQPDKIDGYYYPGYYIVEDRAKRIVNKLKNATEISVLEMEDLINDVTSSTLPILIPKIVGKIDDVRLTENERIAVKILRNWDGSFELNQVAPTIFTKLKYQILKNTFEDELGKKGFQQFLSTHLSGRQFSKQIMSPNSIWNDNVKTLDLVETQKYIINKSFKETIKFLEKQQGKLINKWQWKNVHTVEYEHTLGKVDALRKYFNVGPFPIKGTNEVINNQMFSLNDDGVYKVTAGPSTRRIVDFNDVDNSIAILPTGQSGNVFSKHYKDQAQHYLKGKFFKMLINKKEILKLEDKLIVTPK